MVSIFMMSSKYVGVPLFFLKRTFENIRSNAVISALTVTTIAVSLFIFGVFALAAQNAVHFSEYLKKNIQISAYFKDNLAPQKHEQIRALVRSFEGIRQVDITTSEQAREQFLADNDQLLDVIRELGINPFPASLEIKLSAAYLTRERVGLVIDKLRKLPYFDDIIYGKTWTEYLLSLFRFVYAASIGLGIFLTLAVTFVIHNTISLSLYAKRDELEIISLVGGSRAFLYLPFLLEAFFETLLSSLIALGLLQLTYSILRAPLAQFATFKEIGFLSWYTAGGIVLGSCILGLLGCFLSVFRFRRRLP